MSRRYLLLGLFVITAAALLFVPLPIPPTYAGRIIENAGHMPLFFIGTLFILSILRHDWELAGVRLYAYAGLVGAAASVASEVMQKSVRRDASWDDVLADFVGVICALAVHAVFSRREKLTTATRAIALVIALGCIAAYLAPIINMVRAYLHRDAQFPVLAKFDSRIELSWIVGYGIRRDVIAGVLEVEFVRDGCSRDSRSTSPYPTGETTRPWSSTRRIRKPSMCCTWACGSTTSGTAANTRIDSIASST